MARPTRSNDWGFPRWRGYEGARATTQVRMCDRHGCDRPGDCPAPKSPNNPDRWWFCTTHAGEYNRQWDYFAGLSEEDAAERARTEQRDASGFSNAAHYGWAGPGDGLRSRDELRALDVLGVDADAKLEDVRIAWRRLAKANHPDLAPGDAAAAERFRAIQAAWDVVRTAAERRAAEAAPPSG